jgi:hypothetical protein
VGGGGSLCDSEGGWAVGREKKKKLVGFQPHHGCGVRVWLWSGCGSLCEGGWWAAAAVCVIVREAGQWAEKKKK